MARLEEKFAERALGKSPGLPFDPFTRRDTLTDLPIRQVYPDPDQPRKEMGDLEDLKASIQAVGLVQPIIVAVAGYERYQIIAGERRYTAAKELGLEKIPAIVRTVEEHQLLELQIIENLHRKDLNPFEEAAGYKRLLDDFGLTQEELGRRVGKSQVTISETLRLLALPPDVRQEYRTSDKVSRSLLLEIAKRPEEEQLPLWDQAKQGELTVKGVRARKVRVPKMEEAVSSIGTTFRYPIQTREAVITVAFPDRLRATQERIIAALEEALEGEKARLGVVASPESR